MENASKALIIAGAILIAILLITIGIILINSGRDVAETGVTGMQSQKIQVFNAQFTPYEGKQKGSAIRELIRVVKASNAIDEAHHVYVCGNVQLLSPGQSKNISVENIIKDNKNYNVELYYSQKANLDASKIAEIVLSYFGSELSLLEAVNRLNGEAPIETGYICIILIDNI